MNTRVTAEQFKYLQAGGDPAMIDQVSNKKTQATHRAQILSKGRIAQRGKMNKTEAAYARYLDGLIAISDVARWWFEPFSVRLSHPDTGKPATYCPDFMILADDGTTYIDDVKGNRKHCNEAAIVRIKTAAEMFPLWIWRLVWPDKKGDWEYEVV